MKKRKILYISMSIPYDNVPHAGGKTFNYYINGFANDIDNEVTMIAKVLPEELIHNKCDSCHITAIFKN